MSGFGFKRVFFGLGLGGPVKNIFVLKLVLKLLTSRGFRVTDIGKAGKQNPCIGFGCQVSGLGFEGCDKI